MTRPRIDPWVVVWVVMIAAALCALSVVYVQPDHDRICRLEHRLARLEHDHLAHCP